MIPVAYSARISSASILSRSLRALTLATVATTVIAASSAKADPVNLVQNGSFESTSAYTTNNGTQVGTEISNSNLADWFVTSSTNQFTFLLNQNYATNGFYDPIDGHESTFFAAPGPAPDGSNAITSDGNYKNGFLSQNISGLSVGDRYSLSFFQASTQQSGGYYGSATDAWKVGFGSNVAYSTSMFNPEHGDTPWTKVTMTFIADSTSELLSFFATTSPGAEPPFLLLDNVVLNDVPEPASFAMAGIGLGALLLFRRKRAKSAI